MVDIEKRIKTTEIDFKKTISDIQITDDTFINRSLLAVAKSQNDLIFTLKQKQTNKGGKA